MSLSKYKKEIATVSLIIAAFVVMSFLSERFLAGWAREYNFLGWQGKAIYAAVMATAVIIAPFETLPLMPVATRLWGPPWAAVLTILGWTAGSLIAFSLARGLGKGFVRRYAGQFQRIEDWGQRLGDKNLFWLVAFARFVLPLDIVSYAAGLFTRMRWFTYLAATLVGVVPFAFIFAYGAGLPLEAQAAAGLVIIAVLLFQFPKIRRWRQNWISQQ